MTAYASIEAEWSSRQKFKFFLELFSRRSGTHQWVLTIPAGIAEMLRRALGYARTRKTEFVGARGPQLRHFSIAQDFFCRLLSLSGNFGLPFAYEQAVNDES